MNKIWLITLREFTTRARKKSYILMTILGPVIIAAFFAAMFFLANPSQDKGIKKIAVIDSSGMFIDRIPDTKSLHFDYLTNVNLEEFKKELDKTDYYGILSIYPTVVYSGGAVQFYSHKQPSLVITEYIANQIEKEIRNEKLKTYHIDNIDEILKNVETHVNVQTFQISAEGGAKSSSTGLSMGIAYISSLLIYMFILMYGVQVMRGVMEEKTSRIVEVIVSSVKPYQLMMGKVLGVAMAALIQFIAWIVLTGIFISLAKGLILPDLASAQAALPAQNLMDSANAVAQSPVQNPAMNSEMLNYLNILGSYNYFLILGCFLFYFVGGYLIYSSLFASVGAAADNETDTQQFVFPITMPLILAILVMVSAFQNPDSSLAFWFSMIPLTSPVVMMARLPYGVPPVQLIGSMALLVLTFIGTIWMAGKIYRTGILMYGKKVNFKEIIKWLKYKN